MKNFTYLFLRALLGVIFISHGVARLYYSSVSEFGNFLEAKGIPLGEIVAWAITLGEIIGGCMLVVGYRIRVSIVFHFIIVLFGIILLHFKNGWFVIGHGQNGIEFSVLILAVLIYLFFKK